MGEARTKVVIIDDSPIALETARLALEPNGFTVITLDTPIGASIIAGQEKPDIVLVDVAMASMSGETVVKNLRSRSKLASHTQILLFSDRSEVELQQVATRCGADGYIRKSSDPSVLVNALRGTLIPVR